MSENPYQTPKSELEVNGSEKTTQFYVVSITKFTTLFFLTIGLYAVYWFYKNWKEYKAYNSSNIWPIPRAIFNIFFAHNLFSEVQNSLKVQDKTVNWNPGLLATVYILVAIVSNVSDRMSMKGVGSPYTDYLGLLLLPIMYMTLVKPQKAINISQNDPEGNANSTFTVANYIWMVIGVMFWVLILFGLAVTLGYIETI